MCITAVGFIVPKWFDVFIPPHGLNEAADMYTPTSGMVEPQSTGAMNDFEKGHTKDNVLPSTSID